MEVLAGKSFSFCFVFEGVGRDNKDKGQGGGNKVCKRGDFFFRGRRILLVYLRDRQAHPNLTNAGVGSVTVF